MSRDLRSMLFKSSILNATNNLITNCKLKSYDVEKNNCTFFMNYEEYKNNVDNNFYNNEVIPFRKMESNILENYEKLHRILLYKDIELLSIFLFAVCVLENVYIEDIKENTVINNLMVEAKERLDKNRLFPVLHGHKRVLERRLTGLETKLKFFYGYKTLHGKKRDNLIKSSVVEAATNLSIIFEENILVFTGYVRELDIIDSEEDLKFEKTEFRTGNAVDTVSLIKLNDSTGEYETVKQFKLSEHQYNMAKVKKAAAIEIQSARRSRGYLQVNRPWEFQKKLNAYTYLGVEDNVNETFLITVE